MKSTPIISVMTKNVVCVSPEQKIIDVKHIYEKDKFHRHIPVTDNDRLVGMVSLIDFMYRIKGAGLDDNTEIYNELKVKDIMTTKPSFSTIHSTIIDVAEELAKGEVHAIPIVDNQKVVGIVSTADVIQFCLNSSR